MINRIGNSDSIFYSDIFSDDSDMLPDMEEILEHRTRLLAEFRNELDEEQERPLAEMDETQFNQDFGYLMSYFNHQEEQEDLQNSFQQYSNNNIPLPQSGIHKACIIPLKVIPLNYF